MLEERRESERVPNARMWPVWSFGAMGRSRKPDGHTWRGWNTRDRPRKDPPLSHLPKTRALNSSLTSELSSATRRACIRSLRRTACTGRTPPAPEPDQDTNRAERNRSHEPMADLQLRAWLTANSACSLAARLPRAGTRTASSLPEIAASTIVLLLSRFRPAPSPVPIRQERYRRRVGDTPLVSGLRRRRPASGRAG